MKQRLIGMAVLTAMILSCMTGCGEKDTKVNSNSESDSSVTSSADESIQDEDTSTEVISNTVSIPSSDENFQIASNGVLTNIQVQVAML